MTHIMKRKLETGDWGRVIRDSKTDIFSDSIGALLLSGHARDVLHAGDLVEDVHDPFRVAVRALVDASRVDLSACSESSLLAGGP